MMGGAIFSNDPGELYHYQLSPPAVSAGRRAAEPLESRMKNVAIGLALLVIFALVVGSVVQLITPSAEHVEECDE